MIITDLENNLSQAKIIKNTLLSQGSSYTWLARTTGYSISHVRNVLTERDTLTEKMKEKFIKVLKIEF